MTDKVKLTPKTGVQVRAENGAVIPEKGISVVLTKYYRRRIKDGDLTIEKATKSAAAKTGDK